MRETGIVRRIDELGRVVIPKEIRKTQRIRTGDSLEIYTDGNGGVIFKKYSPLAELGEPAAVYADVLARRLRCAVAVCDREHIVAAAGAGKGELLGAPLPPEIEPLLTRRKLYTAPRPPRSGSRWAAGTCCAPRRSWYTVTSKAACCCTAPCARPRPTPRPSAPPPPPQSFWRGGWRSEKHSSVEAGHARPLHI